MNLKKTALSLFAAGSILLTGFVGVGAQTDSASTNDTVTVTQDGTFDAQFCNPVQMSAVNINSHTPTGLATGSVSICYTDTQAYRGQFRTYIEATDFGYYEYSISAAGFKPTTMYNVAQGQWGLTPGGEDVGDIGAMTGNANYYQGGYVNGGSAQWNGAALNSPLYVNYAWAGVGTGGQEYWIVTGSENQQMEDGSVSKIDLKLEVPSDTTAATYTSTLTLNVYPWAP